MVAPMAKKYLNSRERQAVRYDPSPKGANMKNSRALLWRAATILLGALIVTAVWAQVDAGKTIYQTRCLACHGSTGAGDGPTANYLATKPKNLCAPAFWSQKDPQKVIENAILYGKGGMPAISLPTDEVKAVTEYMAQSFCPKPSN